MRLQEQLELFREHLLAMHEDLVKEKARVAELEAELEKRDPDFKKLIERDQQQLRTIKELRAQLNDATKAKGERENAKQREQKAVEAQNFQVMLNLPDNAKVLTDKINTLLKDPTLAEAIKKKCSDVFGKYIDEKEEEFDAAWKAEQSVKRAKQQPAAALPSDIDKLREMVEEAKLGRDGDPKWNFSVAGLEKRLKDLEEKKKPK